MATRYCKCEGDTRYHIHVIGVGIHHCPECTPDDPDGTKANGEPMVDPNGLIPNDEAEPKPISDWSARPTTTFPVDPVDDALVEIERMVAVAREHARSQHFALIGARGGRDLNHNQMNLVFEKYVSLRDALILALEVRGAEQRAQWGDDDLVAEISERTDPKFHAPLEPTPAEQAIQVLQGALLASDIPFMGRRALEQQNASVEPDRVVDLFITHLANKVQQLRWFDQRCVELRNQQSNNKQEWLERERELVAQAGALQTENMRLAERVKVLAAEMEDAEERDDTKLQEVVIKSLLTCQLCLDNCCRADVHGWLRDGLGEAWIKARDRVNERRGMAQRRGTSTGPLY